MIDSKTDHLNWAMSVSSRLQCPVLQLTKDGGMFQSESNEVVLPSGVIDC